MILIALDLQGRATVVDPSPIAQGTDSESIVLLSPYPVRCPVMMGWVMPDRTAVEIPLDDTENSPTTRYWNMTNVVLPEGYDGNVQSVWTFKPSANLTAQFGTARACFYVQKPVQSEDPLTHTTIQGYKSLTYNPVEIYVTETLNPIPDGDLDPESPLLEQVLEAITYYNTYLADIEENGVSTVHDTEGEPQREVYTDSEATEDSENLITSDGVYKAAQGAVQRAKDYTDDKVRNMPVSTAQAAAIADAEQSAKVAAQGYANTAEQHANAYAEQKADEAEESAKQYAASLVVNDGYGTPVYENGTLLPRFDVHKTYNDIAEVDDTFDENTSLLQLFTGMENNSELVSSSERGQLDGNVQPVYNGIIPYNSTGIGGVISAIKKGSSFRATYTETPMYRYVGARGTASAEGVSSPTMAVYDGSVFSCFPQEENEYVYKTVKKDGESLKISEDMVKWTYCVKMAAYEAGVLFLGEDDNGELWAARYHNGSFDWVEQETGFTLSKPLIYCKSGNNNAFNIVLSGEGYVLIFGTTGRIELQGLTQTPQSDVTSMVGAENPSGAADILYTNSSGNVYSYKITQSPYTEQVVLLSNSDIVAGLKFACVGYAIFPYLFDNFYSYTVSGTTITFTKVNGFRRSIVISAVVDSAGSKKACVAFNTDSNKYEIRIGDTFSDTVTIGKTLGSFTPNMLFIDKDYATRVFWSESYFVYLSNPSSRMFVSAWNYMFPLSLGWTELAVVE